MIQAASVPAVPCSDSLNEAAIAAEKPKIVYTPFNCPIQDRYQFRTVIKKEHTL